MSAERCGHSRPARRVAIALALLIWMSACGGAEKPADNAAPTRRAFGQSMGLAVKFLQGQPLSDLPMLGELKVQWVREHVGWSDVEPEPGRYATLPLNLRRQLAYYRANHIGLVALLTLSSGKSAPHDPADVARRADPGAFGRFAAEAARLLRAEGVRFVLEVGNEPHNSFLRTALGGAWNGKPPSPWLDHYVRMVNAAVRDVKALDPTIQVIAGDDMWVIDHWLLRAGLDPRLDALTIHPYTPGVPEVAAIAHDTDWVQPFTAVDPDRSFQSGVTRLREAARQQLGRPLAVWITEWGWPVAEGDTPVPSSLPERTVAAYLPRAFVLAEEAGVEVTCWFSSQDSVDGPMGLTRNNRLGPRLAYTAYQTLSRELGELSFVRRVHGGRGLAASTQVFLFAKGATRTLIAWQVSGAPTELKLAQAPAQDALTVVDNLGQAQSLRAQAGQFRVPLGVEPVYVRLAAGEGTLPVMSVQPAAAGRTL